MLGSYDTLNLTVFKLTDITDIRYPISLSVVHYQVTCGMWSECLETVISCGDPCVHMEYKAKKAKAQVLGIAPLNMRSMCQRRLTIVEVVTDQHWL